MNVIPPIGRPIVDTTPHSDKTRRRQAGKAHHLSPVWQHYLTEGILQIAGSGLILEGTHATRLSTPPATVLLGTLFWETDRTVIYAATRGTDGITPVWRYAAGRYIDIFANRPLDLGLYDQGFLFMAHDTAHRVWWNIAAWRLENELSDSNYNDMVPVLYVMHRSLAASPAPAAGFGASLEYYLENSLHEVTETLPAGDIGVAWSSAADGNESADVKFRLMHEGSPPRDVMSFLSNGDILMHIPQRRICFGGITAAWGAIGAVGTTVRAALADGSGYTDFEVKDDPYGSSWNGNIEVPTKNALYDKIETITGGGGGPTIATGTYTPAASSLANVSAVSTFSSLYNRVEDMVVVSGQVGVTVASASTPTQFHLSLPIASGLTTPEDLGGTAAPNTVFGMSAAIYGHAASNTARFDFISGPVTGSEVGLAFIFQYRIK